MKIIVRLLFIVILSQNGFAGIPEYLVPNGDFFEYKSNIDKSNELRKYKNLTLAGENLRPYNVLNYDLELDWTLPLSSEPLAYSFTGINTIKILVTNNYTTSIDLDAKDIKINTLRIDDSARDFAQPQNGIFSITLPNPAFIGDTIILSIGYNTLRTEEAGFYLFPKSMFVGFGPYGDSVFTQERIAYTMSEPQDARRWMPCNDAPDDKARATISVKVPKEYTAVSNGKLIRIEENETDRVFHWADTTLISTYLMSVTASIFDTYSEWYHPENSNDSVEVSYYVWESDLDNISKSDSVYNAKHAFRNTVGMIKMYSEKYIPYPFCKYGQVAVQPFNFGGMEHQTITAVNRSWLRGRQEAGIAHELAHQWLGDLVTCDSWDQIWFNEGGATWSEAIWAESWGGYETYLNYMYSYSDQYKRRNYLKTLPIAGIPTDLIFTFPYNYLVYQKASWVYHQLRIMLGDDVFFPVFRSMLNKYAHSNINLELFKNHFKQNVANPKVPFDTFFHQWLELAGHPQFQLSSTSTKLAENSYQIDVTLEQVQTGDNVPELFAAYVPIIAFSADKRFEYFVVNDTKTQSFSFVTDFMPDSITIDNRKVLADIETKPVIVGVDESDTETNVSMTISPNIIESDNSISVLINSSMNGYVIVEIYDILGNRIDTIYSGLMNSDRLLISFAVKSLPSGQYFVKFTDSKNSIANKLIIK